MDNQVCFISYNSRGFDSLKTNLVRQLVSKEVVGTKVPIICNQENFIIRENSYKINRALPGFQVLVNPAVKNDLGLGRPKNGMFIAFPEKIKSSVTDVSPGHWRLQAVVVSFRTCRTLLINSYFPVDSRRLDDEENELLEILGKVREIVRKNDFDNLVWTGDINADFLRESVHTKAVADTLTDLGLTISWDRYNVDFTCYHDILGEFSTSVIDHFFWSEPVVDAVVDAGVLHLVDNKSDHCPIYCVLDLAVLETDTALPTRQKPRPSWRKASSEQKEEFKTILDEKLASIVLHDSVSSCMDMKCRDTKHKEELDTFTMNILSSVQEVAEMTLPVPVHGKHSRAVHKVPGWREEVKPYRDQAYF